MLCQWRKVRYAWRMRAIKPGIIDQVIWASRHIDVFVLPAFQSLSMREKHAIAHAISAEYNADQTPDVEIAFLDHHTGKTLWTFNAQTLPRIVADD